MTKPVKSAKANIENSVSLEEAAMLIAYNPKRRFLLRGEPGIGKSSILSTISAKRPELVPAYVDCTSIELGDIGIPFVNKDARYSANAPNEIFQLHKGKPVLIMLDEFTKAPQAVQNMLHPLLEATKPRLGGVFLPEGSIVFLTGNLVDDGVGDKLKEHTINRISVVEVKKPTAEAWVEWAIGNKVSPVVTAWVSDNPHVMQTYRNGDAAETNGMIFNPRKNQGSFASPRSLAAVGEIIDNRDKYSHEALIAAMTGTVGATCANNMMAYISYHDSLPKISEIIANPSKAPVPTGGAILIALHSLSQQLTPQNNTKLFEYVERFSAEYVAMWIRACFSAGTNGALVTIPTFSKWLSANHMVLPN